MFNFSYLKISVSTYFFEISFRVFLRLSLFGNTLDLWKVLSQVAIFPLNTALKREIARLLSALYAENGAILNGVGRSF